MAKTPASTSLPKSVPKSLPGEWICTKEEVLLASSFMEIVQRDCRSSDDTKLHRFYLFKSKDWCNVIPVTEDGKVVLVKQFRVGITQHTSEIPGGVVDPKDESVQATALREMTEETGYEPLPGAQCVNLGWSWPNPAIQDNRVHSFIVGPVRRSKEQSLDPGEMIEVEEVAIEDIPRMIQSEEISHALMLNTFLFLMLSTDGGPELLRRALRGFHR